MGADLQTPGMTLGWCTLHKGYGAKVSQCQSTTGMALKVGCEQNARYEKEAPQPWIPGIVVL